MIIPPLAPLESASEYAAVEVLLDNDSSTLENVAAFAARMPILACHMLMAANRHEVSGETPIDQLDRAAIILGRQGIHELIDSLRDMPALDFGETFLDADKIRHHMVAVSSAATLAARSTSLPLEREAGIAGLFHDIGICLQLQRNPQGFERAFLGARGSRSRLVEHEQLHCSTDHCEAAEVFLRENGVPENLAVAVGFHHDPLSAPAEHRYLAIVLYAGECLARRASCHDYSQFEPLNLEDKILSELRLDSSVLESLVPLLVEELAEDHGTGIERNRTREGVGHGA